MDITKILSLLFGTISLFGGLAIFFNAARKDSIIAVLTKENSSLKDYNATLENTTTRLTAERDSYLRQYEDIKDLAQGSPQLKVLTKGIDSLRKTQEKQNEILEGILKK